MRQTELRSLLNWVGLQLTQRDNGDLPEWDSHRQQWYVKSLGSNFKEFDRAAESAMRSKVVSYQPMKSFDAQKPQN